MDEQLIKEQVAELYIATFGRAPDSSGLDYWSEQVLSESLTLDGVASSFFDADETKLLYGDVSNEDFIISVYKNALSKTVDSDDVGVKYWLDELENETLSRDAFIKTILDGAKAETGDANDAKLLQNKVKTGLFYVEEIGVSDSPLAKEVISDITFEDSTAKDAMGTISFYKNWINEYEEALDIEASVEKEELYKHINDNEYWDNLEQTYSFNFEIEPELKFWEEDDSIWEQTLESDTNSKFDFLYNEDSWNDLDEFQNFYNGELLDIDIEDENIDIVANDFSDNFILIDIEQYIGGSMLFNDSHESVYTLENTDSLSPQYVEILSVTTSEIAFEVL
jgi:hypothetical protein